ncbi:AbfB domain-containing protein [Streptomyces sp. P17]|uniref:AbfB domain-containing protein n=1 Tax=Streptomyces sp. P17 TaxID=3074716 RepID=UPI0028F456D0|nr:AbfB domain-containing protein [Streptomyces sp. P17]MDT9696008.1 AbfB domain-containing protein [Streptomyces sp. P17]
MPQDKSRPPQDRPWESGWAPDTSRTPGTRRLWLAGALALATIAACVTAIAVTRRPADDLSRSATPTTSASPPGLISFASPSPSTAPAPPLAKPNPPSPHPRTTAPRPGPAPTRAEPPSPSPSPKPSPTSRSVRSVNYPDRYWQVSGDRVALTPAPTPFRVLKGLAKPSCYSFATADGTYLRHREFVLRAERTDGSALFAQDATFCPRPASHPGAIMLESVNYPGRYLRHQNFQLRLDPYQSSDLYRADSAFRLVT